MAARAAPSEVVAQALGYTTFNGASKGVIATLKQYGLLEGAGDGLRVSDHSVSILGLAKGDPDRGRVLSAIIVSPPCVRRVAQRFWRRTAPQRQDASGEEGLHSQVRQPGSPDL